MGKILIDIYDLISQKAGLKGRMRLAVRTGVSRIKASTIPDTKDIVTKFQAAASEILGGESGNER